MAVCFPRVRPYVPPGDGHLRLPGSELGLLVREGGVSMAGRPALAGARGPSDAGLIGTQSRRRAWILSPTTATTWACEAEMPTACAVAHGDAGRRDSRRRLL
jgi:hypothetical protein